MKISELPPKYKKLATQRVIENYDNLWSAFCWKNTKEKGKFWKKVADATNKSELPPIPRKKTQ